MEAIAGSALWNQLNIIILDQLKHHIPLLFDMTEVYFGQSQMEAEGDIQDLMRYLNDTEDITNFISLYKLCITSWHIIPQELWEQIPIVRELKEHYNKLYQFMGVLTYG